VIPEWITDSSKEGTFKSEREYGYKSSNYLFENKKVFISNEFKKENESKSFHEQNFRSGPKFHFLLENFFLVGNFKHRSGMIVPHMALKLP